MNQLQPGDVVMIPGRKAKVIEPKTVIHYDPLVGFQGVCGDDLMTENDIGTIYL